MVSNCASHSLSLIKTKPLKPISQELGTDSTSFISRTTQICKPSFKMRRKFMKIKLVDQNISFPHKAVSRMIFGLTLMILQQLTWTNGTKKKKSSFFYPTRTYFPILSSLPTKKLVVRKSCTKSETRCSRKTRLSPQDFIMTSWRSSRAQTFMTA